MIRRFFNKPVSDGSLTRWENWKYLFWYLRPHFRHRAYANTYFFWAGFGILHERRYYRTGGLYLTYETFGGRDWEWHVFGYTQPNRKRDKLDKRNAEASNV